MRANDQRSSRRFPTPRLSRRNERSSDVSVSHKQPTVPDPSIRLAADRKFARALSRKSAGSKD